MAVVDGEARTRLQEQCDLLAKKLWTCFTTTASKQRLLIAISGIPGAGKSTVSHLVANSVNALHAASTTTTTSPNTRSKFAVSIPMDGFHYTRQQLQQMPQPEVATHRRGAAFTYDAEGFLQFVQALRESESESESESETSGDRDSVFAPSFDHAIKDPVAHDIEISAESKVVLIEGNYCALSREPWASAARLMDELWFIDVDREVARERLAKRHFASGICPDLERAHDRIRTTDFLNADDILDNLLDVQERIRM